MGRPKPPNCMISRFVGPLGPLFMDFNIPEYVNNYKKKVATIKTYIIVVNSRMQILKILEIVCTELLEVFEFEISELLNSNILKIRNF